MQYSSAMVGLRERKKQRTRRALVDAALRLFADKGYEETTLAEIAAAADVSTRTFFSYFASKEDVLFYDAEERMERLLALVASRGPHESPADLLVRLIDEIVYRSGEEEDLTLEETRLRMRLIMSVPPLQARALFLLFDTQLRLAEALCEAYPGRLGPLDAAAAVGALTGAVKLAAMAAISRGASLQEISDTARRAAALAASGLRSLG
ncbi:TetR/AcrR family transcriptional regulator [Nonomuraea pusilla]|uniref:Transcriptional regulator, TetR family n=1 Tax=Nonomuraea pusilla TaxID=46177 RepID=A0A1H7NH93_9ACTN|nr:TetR/AcrR family transcriptional regulator [Nonomuraea pusilla]SEL22774.1 transcriptional regulator, TetR family [Nonomuraea pusilla]